MFPHQGIPVACAHRIVHIRRCGIASHGPSRRVRELVRYVDAPKSANLVYYVHAIGFVAEQSLHAAVIFMKKIVFCADGTWNQASTPQSPSNADTNVAKLYNALLSTATQSTRYDAGLGVCGNPIQHLLGGAFGEGIEAKLRDGYTQISQLYSAGDQIFLFGFSRGAFTARSIAGMLACCGIPAIQTQAAFDDAFTTYRLPTQSTEKATAKADLIQRYGNHDVDIEMIGVWDTVGSLGIPSIFGDIDLLRYSFLDTQLSPRVKAAYQALAIDEERECFPPTLWDDSQVPGQILEQAWFTGCHGNVGGGCLDSTLSDITLKWMLRRCAERGLEIDPQTQSIYQNLDTDAHALGDIDQSWSARWGFPKPRCIPPDATIASPVVTRVAHILQYSPKNLVISSTRCLAPGYTVMSV